MIHVKNKMNIIMKAAALLFILLFTSCSNIILATSYISTPKEAVDIVVENVLSSDKDKALLYVWGPLSKGVDIAGIKEFIMQTPDDGYVVYIDLYPRANMFHPVQYVFIYESTGEYIVKDAVSPPINLGDYQMINTAIGELLNSVENRRAPLPEAKINSQTSASQTKWAVLMNGGASQYSNHVRYWNDLSNIYITLNYVYGYADENIIVLCSDGLDPAPDQSNGQNSDPDLDGDGDDDIMYSCILSNVDFVFADLITTLTEGDKLFVFTTDHGSSNGGWNVLLNLWNTEELTDAHFASLLAALPYCEIICTFEQCYSGGFLDDVVIPPGPVVASSACRHDEYSWAMGNLEYDEYVFHWTAAVKGEDAYGNPVDADYNQDGIITMDEAYLYAVNHDVQPETPQYGDYPEGIGAFISLDISNVAPDVPEKPDGPRDGLVNNEYVYNTTTNDPEGDEIYYMWDWGDEAYSDWLGPYDPGEEAFASKMWDEIGQYYVRVKAKDAPGAESNWSDSIAVNIVDPPLLEIGEITGGLKVNAVVKNSGGDAVGVDTKITVDGGLILFGKEKIGKIPYIETGSQATISSDLILGFGNIQITVEASIKDVSASKTVDGFVFLFLVIIS
jgi:hypothetical protein